MSDSPYATFTADDLARLDFKRLLKNDDDSFLRPLQERAQATLTKFKPITVEERLAGLRAIGFHAHGIYLPDSDRARQLVREEMLRIGSITDDDERLRRYYQLQVQGEGWEKRGIPGEWTGQQALARCTARFRICAWGRRGGKTRYAAAECVGIAKTRPGARIWVAAPISRLVDRPWEYIEEEVETNFDPSEIRYHRNTTQEKVFIFRNGTKISGVSMENVMSMAGEAIDLAVVDEAAQITPDSFYRGILPPLADRKGQVLLISSFEGEGDFFSMQMTKVQARIAEYRSRLTDMMESAPQIEWAYFQAPSYEVNFFAFPRGRKSEEIQVQERNMPVEEFLEQFGAVPMGSRERVYQEFNEKVHVGNFYFDPNLPVTLIADPSGGINEYAIIAVQDHHDDGEPYFAIVDEFYETGMTAEKIAPILRGRPWIGNVTDMIVDQGSGYDEIIRWAGLGFPAREVPDKPEVQESLPLVRNMLRNPDKYYWYYRDAVNRILALHGLEKDADLGMLTDDAKKLYAEVIESLRPDQLSPSDMERLRACSRIFVSVLCPDTITEFKMYSHEKKRKLNQEYKEKPRKFKDHIMDCVRYYVWDRFRHELTSPVALPRTYVGPSATLFTPAEVLPAYLRGEVEEGVTRIRTPGEGFLGHMRALHTPLNKGGRSYLAVA